MAETLSNTALLHELEPKAEELLSQHLATAKEWYPEEHIDFGAATKLYPPGHPSHKPYNPLDTGLSEGTRSALIVNLHTEDNLPYYFRTIDSTLGAESAWGTWTRRWTAEEGRHSIAIRGTIIAKGLLDHRTVEDGRMQQMSSGITPDTGTAADTLVYTDLQELATNISHRNTGRQAKEENPEHKDVLGILALVAGDENRHNRFYHHLVLEGLKIDPSSFVLAAFRQIRHFAMPGTGIKDFETHSRHIAKAGIFNIRIYRDKVLEPTLRAWALENIGDLTPEAEQARDNLFAYINKFDRVLERQEAKAAEQSVRSA